MFIDRVLVLGAASWNRMVHVDNLPQGASATILDARETESVGSTGVGKAMALAGLGAKPALHCALGCDRHASLVIDACEARQISMIVDPQDAPTPHHLNIMDRNGGRYSIFLSNGSPDPTIDEERIGAEIAKAQTIFLCLSNSSKKILHLLKRTKAEVLLDLHDYDGANPWYDDFIDHADVIQVSDVALGNAEATIAKLLSGRAHQIVVTRAEKGAEIVKQGARIEIPPCPARMVDSNGAGDAFSVALWYAQQAGLDLEEAGKFAAAAAAFTIEDPTLFPRHLTVEEIKQRASGS